MVVSVPKSNLRYFDCVVLVTVYERDSADTQTTKLIIKYITLYIYTQLHCHPSCGKKIFLSCRYLHDVDSSCHLANRNKQVSAADEQKVVAKIFGCRMYVGHTCSYLLAYGLLVTTRRVPGYLISYPVGYPDNELPDNDSPSYFSIHNVCKQWSCEFVCFLKSSC